MGKNIQKVWNKGVIIEGYDPKLYRKDVAGALIEREKYGENEFFGWEIDHIYPESKGGGDELINLRPMQWQNNKRKDDDYPIYTTVISSNNFSEIGKEQILEVDQELQKVLEGLYGKIS